MADPAMRSAVVLMAVVCCLPGCIGLTIPSISVPAMATRDAVVYPKCNYQVDDEEAEGAINVTWYKDGVKFYHSVNQGLDVETTLFDVPGVQVDKDDSAFRSLTLKSLKVNSGGKYRCMAASIKNSVMSDIKTMLVVARPENDPVISGLEEGVWVPNGTLELNCTADKSFPAANLTWLVKGEQADEDQLTSWPTERDDEGLLSSKLGLTLQLGPDIRTEVVQVTCEAIFEKDFVEINPNSASSTKLFSKMTVTRKVSPSGAAQTRGQPAAALLALLCSVAVVLTR